MICPHTCAADFLFLKLIWVIWNDPYTSIPRKERGGGNRIGRRIKAKAAVLSSMALKPADSLLLLLPTAQLNLFAFPPSSLSSAGAERIHTYGTLSSMEERADGSWSSTMTERLRGKTCHGQARKLSSNFTADHPFVFLFCFLFAQTHTHTQTQCIISLHSHIACQCTYSLPASIFMKFDSWYIQITSAWVQSNETLPATERKDNLCRAACLKFLHFIFRILDCPLPRPSEI